MCGDFGHAVERPRRRIRPRWLAVYYNLAPVLRVPRTDFAHYIERGIIGSIGGKQNLVTGIVLEKKTFNILFQSRLVAMHGLEYRNGWEIQDRGSGEPYAA